MVAPGAVCCELICVTTFGWPVTIVVSAMSAHAVCTARTKLEAAIDSR
jgi:hypothetical protein